MDLTSIFRRGPYTAFPRSFNPLPHRWLQSATWQVVSGPSGVPAAQLHFEFDRTRSPEVTNPDMTLCLLLDQSGSMTEAYNDGHVHNLASPLVQRLGAAHSQLDLVFYNDSASFVGPIASERDLQAALQQHRPGGGTRVTEALRGAVARYRKKKGIYILVITDGEFADKVQAQNLIIKEFLPQLTPDNPYAFRLHFIGAGPDVDREFLEQLERAASSQGVAMVTGHHHAHISHAHQTIQAEMERSFIGVGQAVEFKRPDVSDGESHHIARVVQAQTQNSRTGDDDRFSVLPLSSTWIIEVAPTAAAQLQVVMSFSDSRGEAQGRHEIPLSIPMVAPQARPSGWHFHWPWENEAAANQRKARMAQAAADLEAAQARAREDLKALSRGDIPVQARQRLQELRADPNALFSSDLDPSEAALLRRVGYRPLALVTGSAMYHVGQAFASTMDCEVNVLSQAYDEATRLAVSRMEAELKVVGAHGVIGVRFEMARREWGDKTIEVMVVGTAVVGPGQAPDEPFLCDLSGHEWWALRRAGYEPCELVWGHCSWFIFTSYDDDWAVRNYQNTELTHWSTALNQARTIALRRAGDMARAEHAHGIVGVDVERRLSEVRLTGPGADPAYEREHHNLLVTILGTAIRPREGAPHMVPPSALVLSLRDGQMTPVGALRETDAKFE